MIPSKGMVGMLVVFCLCTMAFSLQAQEEPAYMYLGEKAEQTDSDTIYTGKVIAYGELLDPPYYIEFRDDTVWVNNIPVHPPIRMWEEEQIEYAVNDTQRLVYQLERNIGNDFVSFYNHYGEKKAVQMLSDKYASHPLIKELKFLHLKKEGIVTGVCVEFTNGYKTSIGSSKARDEDGKIVEYDYPKDKHRENMKRIAEMEKSWLRKGYLVGYGWGGSGCRRPGPEQDLYLRTLERIAKGEITIDEAISENPALLPRPTSYFWNEFELKQDTWK